jgi:integrase
LVGAEWEDRGLIFCTRWGRPLDSRNVTQRMQEIVAKSGLPHQRFHDLRHGCATLLLAQGVSARVVMETLGHSQISLTLGTYSHVVPALQQEAARRLDEVLTGR